MKRDFLKDISIVGAMLASYEERLLDYSIPNLLKWCDWVLIMLDNQTEKTEKIANVYKEKYPDRIRIEYTRLPEPTEAQAKARELIRHQKGGILRRYKQRASDMRESVFSYMKGCLENGEKVDLLIFTDADEIFSDSFPETLVNFWNWEGREALVLKPSDVFGDMKTLRGKSMGPHVRVLKFDPKYTAIPYRNFATYVPLTRKELLGSRYVMIHLNALLEETREWKNVHWKKAIHDLDEPLWRVEKDIRQMTPSEVVRTIKGKPSMTVGEYLKRNNLKT